MVVTGQQDKTRIPNEMIAAHANSDLLAAYADGSLSDGMSLLVASHLTFCPECRDRVRRLETLGGALLAEGQSVALPPDSLARALDRLDGADADPAPAATAPVVDPDSPLPAPLRARIGVPSTDIRWAFRLPGLSEYRLDGFDGEEVSLLRARPGVRILSHTHTGEEATLVLTGALSDGGRVYRRGDVALADERHDHHPEIVGDEICICLVVLSGPMRFTGPVGRALNFLRN
jgi:putative transcriptional regulator